MISASGIEHPVSPNEGPAARRWRALVERRAQQMDAAYAALNRSSADYWARRVTNRPSMLRRLASEDDPIVQALLPYLEQQTNLEQQTTLLDVGAGAGRYALALAPRVASLVAVEPDAAMLPLLRDGIREAGAGNVEVVAATWQDAAVEAADIVLCAHVLYPIADAVPFVRKLGVSARRACFLALRDVVSEPEPLGRLWQRFHGEPRYLQPGYLDAYALLYEIGIRANVRVSQISRPSWSFPDVEAAVDSVREHLILPERDDVDEVLRTELAAALVSDGELLRLEVEPTYSAVIWWESSA